MYSLSRARGAGIFIRLVRTQEIMNSSARASSQNSDGGDDNDANDTDAQDRAMYGDNTADQLHAFQGRQHEFTATRARDSMEHVERIQPSPMEILKGIQEGREGPTNLSQAGMNAQYYTDSSASRDTHSEAYDCTSQVSLHSVMQSMVPEPFQPSERCNPSHQNMPMGSANLGQKYLSGSLQDVHPSHDNSSNSRIHDIHPHHNNGGSSRKFSSSAKFGPLNNSSRANVQDAQTAGQVPVDFEDFPTPEGIQGDDCARYKLWMENCKRFQFSNCDEQLQGIQSGRKTLSQVFAEQDEVIRQAVKYSQRPRHMVFSNTDEASQQGVQGPVAGSKEHMSISDMEGVQGPIAVIGGLKAQKAVSDLDEACQQGVQGPIEGLAGHSMQTILRDRDTCPQGVQGSDCQTFKLWLENCGKYGFGNCEEQLKDLQTGRKTLAQVFDEQDKLIRQVAETYSQQMALSTAERN